MTTLREFYSYYIQLQIEEKKEIVLINPFYETTDLVRETLSTGYKEIDVDKYEKKEKRLVIFDSLKKYLGQKEKTGRIAEADLKEVNGINASKEKDSNKKVTNEVKDKSNWLLYNEQLINHAKKERNTRLSILADVGPFYFVGKAMELFEYECSLPKQFDPNTKAFCIYHQKDFDKFTEGQKQKLAKHHGMVIKIQAH